VQKLLLEHLDTIIRATVSSSCPPQPCCENCRAGSQTLSELVGSEANILGHPFILIGVGTIAREILDLTRTIISGKISGSDAGRDNISINITGKVSACQIRRISCSSVDVSPYSTICFLLFNEAPRAMPSPSVYSGQKEGSLAHFFCTSAL
jgi:hypothetical protein